MPRKPKFYHPVRRVRQSIGLSQPAFAKLVCTSSATIKSVELGRLEISPGLASRICAATGVRPDSIMKRSGKPKDLNGEPYSEQSYKLLIKERGQLSKECADLCRKRALLYLDALLRASDNKEKNRFAPLLVSFNQWLQSSRREMGLEKASEQALRELSMKETRLSGKHVVQSHLTWSTPFVYEPGDGNHFHFAIRQQP